MDNEEKTKFDKNFDIIMSMEEKTYAQKVKELLNLPQSLCKKCGQCCNTVIFKYGLTYDECASNDELDAKLDWFLEGEGARILVCDVDSENNVK